MIRGAGAGLGQGWQRAGALPIPTFCGRSGTAAHPCRRIAKSEHVAEWGSTRPSGRSRRARALTAMRKPKRTRNERARGTAQKQQQVPALLYSAGREFPGVMYDVEAIISLRPFSLNVRLR